MDWVRGDSTWRTEPLIEPADRQRVLKAFRNFFVSQVTERSLKNTVKRSSGLRLPVGFPPGWTVVITPRGQLPELMGRNISDLLLTHEWLVVLGELRSPTKAHTSLYLAMGRESRMFVYSALEDALVIAANDLDDLSRRGLSMVEFVFKRPDAMKQRPQMGSKIWDRLCSCADEREFASLLYEKRCHAIEIKTPGKSEGDPFILIDKLKACELFWPFSAMSDSQLKDIRKYISIMTCCRWETLGLVGTYRSTGVFHTLLLVIRDEFGAVFYLSTLMGQLWRLADSVSDLRMLGLLKVFAAGRRADRDTVGQTRIEHPINPSIWFHCRPGACHLCPDVAPPGDGQLMQQYAWMSREGRASLQTERETIVHDNIVRMMRLNPITQNGKEGFFRSPDSMLSIAPQSTLRSMLEAIWRGDDSWREAVDEADYRRRNRFLDIEDEESDSESKEATSVRFRERQLPPPPLCICYRDHTPTQPAVNDYRVVINSETAGMSAFHVPIVEPPLPLRRPYRCLECDKDPLHTHSAV